MKRLLMCLALFLAGSAPAQADMILGVGLTSDPNIDELLSIDSGTGAVTIVGSLGRRIRGIAFGDGGVLLGIDRDTDELVSINTATGATTSLVTLSTPLRELAFYGGTLYGSAGDDLQTINTSTGVVTSVGLLGVPSIRGLTFDDSGVLYATNDNTPPDLLTINQSTAATAAVGSLGGSVGRIGGLAFDSNGALFGVDNTAQTLLTINTTTGAATNVASIGHSVRGLAFAPAAVPEPSSFILASLGVVGWGAAHRRRKSNRSRESQGNSLPQ